MIVRTCWRALLLCACAALAAGATTQAPTAVAVVSVFAGGVERPAPEAETGVPLPFSGIALFRFAALPAAATSALVHVTLNSSAAEPSGGWRARPQLAWLAADDGAWAAADADLAAADAAARALSDDVASAGVRTLGDWTVASEPTVAFDAALPGLLARPFTLALRIPLGRAGDFTGTPLGAAPRVGQHGSGARLRCIKRGLCRLFRCQRTRKSFASCFRFLFAIASFRFFFCFSF